MSYAVFQCHTEGCTVMIRCPVGMCPKQVTSVNGAK